MGQQTQFAYGTQALHTQVKFAILPFLCSLCPLLSGAKKKIAQLSLLTRHKNNKDMLIYGRTFMNLVIEAIPKCSMHRQDKNTDTIYCCCCADRFPWASVYSLVINMTANLPSHSPFMSFFLTFGTVFTIEFQPCKCDHPVTMTDHNIAMHR